MEQNLKKACILEQNHVGSRIHLCQPTSSLEKFKHRQSRFHISSISYSSLLLISIFSMTFTKEIKLHHSPVTPQFTTQIQFHLKKGYWTKNCLKVIDKKAIKPGEKITGGSYFDDFIVFSDYYGNASFLILSVWFMILPPPATTTISAAAGQKRHAAHLSTFEFGGQIFELWRHIW